MTFLTALVISVVYVFMGFVVAAAATEGEGDINVMIVIVWPIAIVGCIVHLFIQGLRTLIKRFTK